jgi:hypothetical protein
VDTYGKRTPAIKAGGVWKREDTSERLLAGTQQVTLCPRFFEPFIPGGQLGLTFPRKPDSFELEVGRFFGFA